jgi:hypothetical protein
MFYLFANGTDLVTPVTMEFAEAYDRWADPDGFLYILYSD